MPLNISSARGVTHQGDKRGRGFYNDKTVCINQIKQIYYKHAIVKKVTDLFNSGNRLTFGVFSCFRSGSGQVLMGGSVVSLVTIETL